MGTYKHFRKCEKHFTIFLCMIETHDMHGCAQRFGCKPAFILAGNNRIRLIMAFFRIHCTIMGWRAMGCESYAVRSVCKLPTKFGWQPALYFKMATSRLPFHTADALYRYAFFLPLFKLNPRLIKLRELYPHKKFIMEHDLWSFY